MSIDAATIKTAFAKGNPVTVTLTDGTTLVGDFVSVTEKSITVAVKGKNVSRVLTKVDAVDATAPGSLADMFTDAESYTTAQVALALNMAARDLRIKLREYNMGVGKGQTYTFTPAEARNVARRVQSETGV